jgi:hypothetical protein
MVPSVCGSNSSSFSEMINLLLLFCLVTGAETTARLMVDWNCRVLFAEIVVDPGLRPGTAVARPFISSGGGVMHMPGLVFCCACRCRDES